MPNWIIIVTLLVLALLLALGLFLLARQRKRTRLELRLASGRRQLLGRELQTYLAELDGLDEEAIAAKRQDAENALDQLHIALVECQAHLLNYEDMAHLQQCKIDQLSAVALAPPEAPIEALSETTPPTEPQSRRPERLQRELKQPTVSEHPAEGRDRTTIEGDLLDKINQLQGRKKPKK